MKQIFPPGSMHGIGHSQVYHTCWLLYQDCLPARRRERERPALLAAPLVKGGRS